MDQSSPSKNTATSPASSWGRRVVYVLFGASWLVAIIVFYAVVPGLLFTEDIGRHVPSEFPVLVIVPISEGDRFDARVVYYKDLTRFLTEHPDSTFLVPAGREVTARDQAREKNGLSNWPEEPTSKYDVPWWTDFRVEQLATDRQGFQVTGDRTDDETLVGIYEATAKEILPKAVQSYNAKALFFVAVASTLVANLALWGIGWLLRKTVWKPSSAA